MGQAGTACEGIFADAGHRGRDVQFGQVGPIMECKVTNGGDAIGYHRILARQHDTVVGGLDDGIAIVTRVIDGIGAFNNNGFQT